MPYALSEPVGWLIVFRLNRPSKYLVLRPRSLFRWFCRTVRAYGYRGITIGSLKLSQKRGVLLCNLTEETTNTRYTHSTFLFSQHHHAASQQHCLALSIPSSIINLPLRKIWPFKMYLAKFQSRGFALLWELYRRFVRLPTQYGINCFANMKVGHLLSGTDNNHSI